MRTVSVPVRVQIISMMIMYEIVVEQHEQSSYYSPHCFLDFLLFDNCLARYNLRPLSLFSFTEGSIVGTKRCEC